MSVHSWKQPDSDGRRGTLPTGKATAREPQISQLTGHLRRWWQVLWWQVLGSNLRRLSRRFYRPLIIKSVCPLRASPYGGSSDHHIRFRRPGELSAVVDSLQQRQPWPRPPRQDMHTMIAQGSARIQHRVGNRWEPTGNNGQSADPPGPDDRPADPPALASRHPRPRPLTSGNADRRATSGAAGP